MKNLKTNNFQNGNIKLKKFMFYKVYGKVSLKNFFFTISGAEFRNFSP